MSDFDDDLNDLHAQVRADLQPDTPVRFLGGGPLMTVTEVLPNTKEVKVQWMDDGITRKATFPRGMLAIGHETPEEAGQLPINVLQERIHQTAVSKGWWDDGDLNFGELCALIHAKVSEAFEAYRDGHDIDEVWVDDGKPEGVFVELADVIIRILDAAERYKVDMAKIISVKMRFNQSRAHRHGGRRA